MGEEKATQVIKCTRTEPLEKQQWDVLIPELRWGVPQAQAQARAPAQGSSAGHSTSKAVPASPFMAIKSIPRENSFRQKTVDIGSIVWGEMRTNRANVLGIAPRVQRLQAGPRRKEL